MVRSGNIKRTDWSLSRAGKAESCELGSREQIFCSHGMSFVARSLAEASDDGMNGDQATACAVCAVGNQPFFDK